MSEDDPGNSQAAPSLQAQMVNRITDVPTVYADGCVFASRSGETIRLTFAENMLAPSDSDSPGLKLRHVGHLVMPISGFLNMMDYLARSVADLRSEGPGND